MEFIVFISYILFAFLLFLFLNFLMKKFSLNKIEYILFSNIFLVVVASFASYFHLSTFCDNIFIIIVFEFLIRMLYTTYILEKDFFSKEDHQLLLYLENIIVAYLLNQFIIRQVDMVFLNPEQLKFLLWVFIFIFLYHFLYQGRTSNFKMLVHKQQEIGDKKQYIITQYAKMKQKYGNDIHVKGNLRLLVYAIMIFENNRRPKFFRQLDYFRYQFDHIPKKQGIMQVDSKKIINDVESIEMVEKKLQTKKKTKKSDDSNAQLLKRLGKKANEIEQIEKVYQVIEEFLEL
jgi:hypothetical protein